MQDKEAQAQMFNMIIDWQQSGLSQKKYCEAHGIRYHVFHYWFRRYRSQHTDHPDAGFIPVQIESLPGSHVQAGIELVLTDGRRILFHQPISADFIKAIIS